MSLYLPPELRWLGWVAGSSWPDGDEDGMWAIAEDWKAAATALTSQEPLVLKAKQDTERAYTEGAGADAMGAHFDQLIEGDHSVKALAETLNAVYESTFDMGTQLQATKITIVASLCWLAMEIAWAWLYPPTAPAAEAAGIATTRSFLKAVEDYIQNAIERLAGNLGASTMKNRYFWKELVTGGKLIMPSAKGFGVYAVKAMEGATMSAVMDGAVQVGQIAAGKRHGFDWKEFGVSIGASVAGSIPGRELARYAGNGIDKLFGNELKKMNIPLGSWTYPAGAVIRGGAIGVISGATSSLFGDMVAAAAYGPSAFTSPAGWVGGMARGGIVGAARGTFVKNTPATGGDIRSSVWMTQNNFSTTNKVSRTSRLTATPPTENAGGGTENAGAGGGNRSGGTFLDDSSSVSGGNRGGGASLNDAASVGGGNRGGGTFLDDSSSINNGSRGGGSISDGSSIDTGGRRGGALLDDSSSVNGGNRGGGTFLDDTSSVDGGGWGMQGGRSFLHMDDQSSIYSYGSNETDSAQSFGHDGRSVGPSEQGSEGGSHDSILSYYFNHAGGGSEEVPPAGIRSTVEPPARTTEPPNSFQSSVDGGWTPPNRGGGATEGLQENIRPGGSDAAQGDSSTTGIRSGVAGQGNESVGGGVRGSSVGEQGQLGGGGRPGRSFLNMDDSSSEGSSIRGSVGGESNGGRVGVGGEQEQAGPVGEQAGTARGGAPGTEGQPENQRAGGTAERPEPFLGKATDMKGKTRPKREPEWAPLPGPFEAPTAPSAADWLPGATGPDATGASGPPSGATGSGENPSGTNPNGTNPTGSSPNGTNPNGSNPNGTNPNGTNPTGTNPTGTNPTGTNPTGTNPTGTNPTGTNPNGTENDIRAGISTVDVPFNLGGNNR
jgi:hypothetical protein